MFQLYIIVVYVNIRDDVWPQVLIGSNLFVITRARLFTSNHPNSAIRRSLNGSYLMALEFRMMECCILSP